MDPDELEEFKNLFDLVQKKSGTDEIDREEFGILMKTIGVGANEKELDEMMELVDEDGSGLIDFSEFLMVMGQQHFQTFDSFSLCVFKPIFCVNLILNIENFMH